jgi:PKD domain/Secretion system C-terminal sorting domain
VKVSISNGFLGNVSFAGTSAGCYTPLVGSSSTSASFNPSCAATPNTGIDMLVCPKATANPTIINYTIIFANGEICEKADTLNCIDLPLNCCEKVEVIKLSAQGKCCSEIKATCPIKNLAVSVSNGTLGDVSFLGATAGCYTAISGSALTTTNFNPNCSGTIANSGVDLVICPKPTANPMYITYVITFGDGTTCTKYDTLNCVSDCCKETILSNSTSQGKCCSNIKTTCKIKVVQVIVLNGVLGNVSFGGPDAACYTPIVNSTSTNIMIVPALCNTGGNILDMTVCPKPTANPVIIKYVISFTNGVICEKFDTLKCPIDTACTIAACFAHTATGLSVNFNATGTTSNYPIVMYVWNYGDGTYGTSTTPTMSHNYTTSGTYEVCMTVQVLYKGTICDCSKKICKTIKIEQGITSSSACTSSLTGTGASTEVGQLKAYPNPSNRDFHVTLDKMESVLENGKAEIRLYNVQGKLILTKTIDVLTKEFDIQAESYPAGLYMMTLQKDGEVISSIKVVKN